MGDTVLQDAHQLVFQKVTSGVRVLADINKRVWSSSSERTGAGKMRFFACDAWVEENCRIEHLVGVARSVLVNKETGFMVTE
jgi:hypothetical protein